MAKGVFTVDQFVFEKIMPQAAKLDASPALMAEVIEQCMQGLRSLSKSDLVLFSAKEMDWAYRGSTAFAFTIAQHFVAIERLEKSVDWQKRNPELWGQLRRADLLCGLATTHLAKPGEPALKGASGDKGGFLLNGFSPWSCGYKIFDKLVVGFDAGEEIIFACVNYPARAKEAGVKVTPNKLACMNGTSSVRFDFKNYVVNEEDVVSRREKTVKVKNPPSRYVGTELGIGKAALETVISYTKITNHPKNDMLLQACKKMKIELATIMKAIDLDPNDHRLGMMIAEFNFTCVRLAGLALGAKALLKDSAVARWQQELILFDAVIQSPKTLELKINQLA
jgi:hypothetical protein